MRTIETITLEEIADEVKREIKMRQRVYPRWVEIGKMSEHDASLQMLKMQACLAFIEADLKKNAAQKELFG